MHKNIALVIKKIVDESPYNHFTCEIIPDSNGSLGFWKAILKFKRRNDAHSSALVDSLHDIGMVFGEGLCVEDKGNVVEVS